ncbi:SDR family NAD(P)-dependent oxidoreductase [uncultured Jatrophihabitans sp.]|uniref:SDR family NAD(P)-dependent oxidoreductase n=1 Tax=uncultured Jatrophihabitans sp. TaxID=1610747 RepID=UPI0035CAC914
MSARRSALITGGSSGIGLACARTLHREGWDVSLVGRRESALLHAADSIQAGGGDGEVATFIADLGTPDAPGGVVEQHTASFGAIDALVAGAGNYDLDDVRSVTAERWDTTLNLHLRGAVLAAGAAARHMSAAGCGRIVLLSSVNGLHSEPESIAYSAAKTAIISVARSLAVDLAPGGVQANAVAPGWVTTPMTEAHLAATSAEQLRRVNPMGRAGTADEIAGLVRYLIVDAPDFLTGATITIDGGQTALAPMP